MSEGADAGTATPSPPTDGGDGPNLSETVSAARPVHPYVHVVVVAVIGALAVLAWLIVFEEVNKLLWENEFVTANRWMFPVICLPFSLLVGLLVKYRHAPTNLDGSMLDSLVERRLPHRLARPAPQRRDGLGLPVLRRRAHLRRESLRSRSTSLARRSCLRPPRAGPGAVIAGAVLPRRRRGRSAASRAARSSGRSPPGSSSASSEWSPRSCSSRARPRSRTVAADPAAYGPAVLRRDGAREARPARRRLQERLPRRPDVPGDLRLDLRRAGHRPGPSRGSPSTCIIGGVMAGFLDGPLQGAVHGHPADGRHAPGDPRDDRAHRPRGRGRDDRPAVPPGRGRAPGRPPAALLRGPAA